MVHGRSTFRAGIAAVILGVSGWCFLPAARAENSLNWQPTLEEAKREAAQSNRLILVHFWAPWCKECQQLERDVFAQPEVQQAIDARFVPLKLNADDYPTTAKQYGVESLPTDLIITAGGKIVGRMRSPMVADAYLTQLSIAASGSNLVSNPVMAPSPVIPAKPSEAAAVQAPAATVNDPPSEQIISSTIPSPAQPDIARYANLAQQPYIAQQPAASMNSAQPTAPETAAPPAVPAYSQQRYSEYYQRFAQAPQAAATGTVSQDFGVSDPSPSATGALFGPPAMAGQNAGASSGAIATGYSPLPTGAPAGSATLRSTDGTSAAGQPPLGLDGYCPVTLVEKKHWQVGDRRFGVVHRGRTYLFVGAEEQKKFLASPDRYSPAASGQDVVMALDQGQSIDGQRQFGVEYQNRVYLFSSDAARRTFTENPKRYATEVLQAEAPTHTLLR